MLWNHEITILLHYEPDPEILTQEKFPVKSEEIFPELRSVGSDLQNILYLCTTGSSVAKSKERFFSLDSYA